MKYNTNPETQGIFRRDFVIPESELAGYGKEVKVGPVAKSVERKERIRKRRVRRANKGLEKAFGGYFAEKRATRKYLLYVKNNFVGDMKQIDMLLDRLDHLVEREPDVREQLDAIKVAAAKFVEGVVK